MAGVPVARGRRGGYNNPMSRIIAPLMRITGTDALA
jgi:hypothetical protein